MPTRGAQPFVPFARAGGGAVGLAGAAGVGAGHPVKSGAEKSAITTASEVRMVLALSRHVSVVRNGPGIACIQLLSMKLSDKGRFAPPPPLPKHAELVSQTLASWPGVNARTHWLLGDESEVDGADFYVGEDEIGHLHLEGEAHVATGLTLRKALVASELAAPFAWSTKFVVHQVQRASQVEHALWLFRLAYDRLTGTSDRDLVARISAYDHASR